MFKRAVMVFAAAVFAVTLAARADEAPTYNGPLSPAEQAFVQSIQSDLMKRFPTAADAEKAGYVRYTNEDETGAISYANLQWESKDPQHPSQLWYDNHGQLLGADYSALKTSNTRPSLFNVNPGRLYQFNDHVHWVGKDTNGKLTYDNYVMAGRYKAAGGDPQHPSAAQLLKMGRIANASQVVTIFDMPSIWDLIVWVKPNPHGAFAGKNPNVKP